MGLWEGGKKTRLLSFSHGPGPIGFLKKIKKNKGNRILFETNYINYFKMLEIW